VDAEPDLSGTVVPPVAVPPASVPAARVVAGSLPTASAITSRTLRLEIVAVLALSLGASAVSAVLDLVHNLVVAVQHHQALTAQTASLYAPADSHPYLDLAYQLLFIATELAPVLLVGYLLARSHEGFGTLGVDRARPKADMAVGVVLAVVVGSVGLAALVGFNALGFNFTIVVGSAHHYWWMVPLLVLHAAGTAIEEEVIVGAYLLHRLNQLGWNDGRALVVSALLRGAYHLYQGPGSFVSNAVLGLFFGRIFQTTRRGGPLVLAHFLVDAVAFVGYLELRGKLSWLP
jgi:membrane protease YdiL (CAAX protease family)